MIEFSNFQKSVLHKGMGCYEVFAWTFEFSHNHKLDDLDNVELFTNKQDAQLPFPQSRTHCKIGISPALDTLRINASEKLQNIFPLLASEETQYFKSRWMWDPKSLQPATYTFTDVVRDSDGFMLGPHIDNGFIIGNAVMNLVDNNCGTLFHQLSPQAKPEFIASGERGKGVFFLNGPGALHSITNDSGRTRYTLATSWQLRKDSSIRNTA